VEEDDHGRNLRNLQGAPMGSAPALRLRGMAAAEPTPLRARVELVRDGCAVDVGPIAPKATCDGELLDDLLRFDLAARRLGWKVRLRDVDAPLSEVLHLVDVLERLSDELS
jgi:hypothetical protein